MLLDSKIWRRRNWPLPLFSKVSNFSSEVEESMGDIILEHEHCGVKYELLFSDVSNVSSESAELLEHEHCGVKYKLDIFEHYGVKYELELSLW